MGSLVNLQRSVGPYYCPKATMRLLCFLSRSAGLCDLRAEKRKITIDNMAVLAQALRVRLCRSIRGLIRTARTLRTAISRSSLLLLPLSSLLFFQEREQHRPDRPTRGQEVLYV